MDFLCSDERITRPGLANPGSVLFDLVILKQDPAALAARYRAVGVTTIFAHEECGAARAALGKAEATWDEVTAWAQEETKKFCNALGFAYGFIPASEFVPQGHVHPGTTMYISDVPEHRGGYRVSPSVSTDPVAAANALLTLVAFKSGNGGDTARANGKKFVIYVDDPSRTSMTVDTSVAPFVEVHKVR